MPLRIKSSNLKSSIVVNSFTVLSRVTGLIRDIATTAIQGADFYHDIFIVILRIPASIRTFLVEGAFSNAFIPTYSNLIGKKKFNESVAFLNSITFLVLVVSLLLIIISQLFPNIFVLVFASGYYADESKLKIASEFNRIMFPYLGFIALVSFAGGIQNSNNKFGIPAATPVLFNITLIASAFFAKDFFNIPIYAVVWGVLLSGLLQLIVQFQPLFKLNIKLRPAFTRNLDSIKTFKSLFVPSLVIGALMQINIVIDTIFSTFLEEGSPTWLYLSQRLMQLPLGIFAMAISTVLLPHLSKLFALNNKKNFSSSLKQSIRIVLFVGLPSMIGLSVLSEEIISTIFLRGEFAYMDVYKTSYSLIVLSIALPFLMIQRVLQPAFFSRLDTKAPLIISMVSVSTNIIMNYVLAFYLKLGHVGIAGGFLVASLISSTGFLYVLYKKGIISSEHLFNQKNLITILITFLLAIILFFASKNIPFAEILFINKIIVLFSLILSSVLIYMALAYLFGIRLKDFKNNS